MKIQLQITEDLKVSHPPLEEQNRLQQAHLHSQEVPSLQRPQLALNLSSMASAEGHQRTLQSGSAMGSSQTPVINAMMQIQQQQQQQQNQRVFNQTHQAAACGAAVGQGGTVANVLAAAGNDQQHGALAAMLGQIRSGMTAGAIGQAPLNSSSGVPNAGLLFQLQTQQQQHAAAAAATITKASVPSSGSVPGMSSATVATGLNVMRSPEEQQQARLLMRMLTGSASAAAGLPNPGPMQ